MLLFFFLFRSLMARTKAAARNNPAMRQPRLQEVVAPPPSPTMGSVSCVARHYVQAGRVMAATEADVDSFIDDVCAFVARRKREAAALADEWLADPRKRLVPWGTSPEVAYCLDGNGRQLFADTDQDDDRCASPASPEPPSSWARYCGDDEPYVPRPLSELCADDPFSPAYAPCDAMPQLKIQ